MEDWLVDKKALAETLCPRTRCGGSAAATNTRAHSALRRKHPLLGLSAGAKIKNN
jgi:hypothetical protein